MKSAIFSLIIFFCFSAANLDAQTFDYTRYVNPFVGTGGHGHTFPGATVPFGFVQLSPDTRLDNWDGSSGYHYSDSTIYGFSHTHLSGTGIPDYCDVLLMPTVGEAQFTAREGEKDVNGYASKFSHQNETATAGFYSVKLDDDGIFAEMTATKRVGLHRYTFPKSDEANIILDLKWRDKVLDSELKVVGNNRIEGFRRSSSWAKNQIVYFVAEFSKPFADKAEIKEILTSVSRKPNADRENGSYKTDIKAAFRFKTEANEKILVKVAVSPVSIEGARRNLQAELPDWNFEKVRRDAKIAWSKELSKIEVTGGSDDQLTNFYTALYHTMIAPNVFQDVDGQYLGLDKKVHTAAKGTNYTIFSLWDTFRAAHPLYTIIDEKRTADFINTFIRQYEQGGRLPVWELAANETDTMIGYHAVSVIADAMAKDIKGFDYERAFAAAKHSAELNRFGLEAYKRRGYVAVEDENESVSKTLEYAYNDACIAQMALTMMSKQIQKLAVSVNSKSRSSNKNPAAGIQNETERLLADFDKYARRSQYYKNLFDAETGFMRPRKNGNFVSPFRPNEVTFHFTEANSWQYSFFVPHDVSELINLHGGKRNFAKKLDELFTTDSALAGREQPDITGLIGQYAHGNEPSHHIAYLYNYADEPWKTQKIVRRVMDEFYKPTTDGLIGNEDCGQMSAWFVLSSLGFYQVSPGRVFYDIGTPLFREAKIKLANGKFFIIKASNVSDKNIYVKSAVLNGNKLRSTVFSHRDFITGGTLEFEMTDVPDKTWFNEFSVSKVGVDIVSVPVIGFQSRTFKAAAKVAIKTNTKDAKILYSIDGSEPNIEYNQAFEITDTATVKAVAVNDKGGRSFVVESKLNRIPHDWTVRIFSKYNRQYTGGGDEGLLDGIRGGLNFASGEWQGYQAQDFVAVIDLQKPTEIKKLGGGFLQNARSWIWMPTRIEFETSDDNVNFKRVAEIKTDVAPENMTEQTKDYFAEIAPVKARYVRVKADNLGKIPAWHPGANDDAFIFVDEIIIE